MQIVHAQRLKQFYETLFNDTDEPPLLSEEPVSGGET